MLYYCTNTRRSQRLCDFFCCCCIFFPFILYHVYIVMCVQSIYTMKFFLLLLLLLYPGQPSFSDLCRMNMIPSVCKPRCQFRYKHFPYLFPSSRHICIRMCISILYTDSYTIYTRDVIMPDFSYSTRFNFMLIVFCRHHTTAQNVVVVVVDDGCIRKIFSEFLFI